MAGPSHLDLTDVSPMEECKLYISEKADLMRKHFSQHSFQKESKSTEPTL